MHRKSDRWFKAGKWTFILTVIFTLLTLFIDVDKIGPEGSSVGFSKLNNAFIEMTGFNAKWYDISGVLGKIAFIPLVIFAMMGFFQLVKERNLLKVDVKIRALGIFYIVVLIIYGIFTVVAVNYRPVMLEGELESSFPSSHTMLAICIYISAVIMINKMMEKKPLKTVLILLCLLLMIISVLARTLSGVHWITDIFAGILLSSTLLFYFKGILERQEGK